MNVAPRSNVRVTMADRKTLLFQIRMLDEQIKVLVEQRERLLEILDGPRVLVESWRWVYGSLDFEEHDTVAEAASFLDFGEEEGHCFAEGIKVGGAWIWRKGDEIDLVELAKQWRESD